MASASRLKRLIGKATRPKVFEIEKGQIRRFAVAIGEDDPVHLDEKAAKAAGFPSLVAPPTFAAALDNTAPLLEELGLDERSTMHREEEYEYFRPVCAGDELSVAHRVVDLYESDAPHGKLLFAVIETRATDKKSRTAFKGRRVLVKLCR